MTSMYGLNIDLPPNWLDITEYLFEAQGSLLPKLIFSREPLTPGAVDPWLEDIRRDLAVFDGMQVTPITDYENPTVRVRGFDAVVADSGEREGTSFIVFSFATHAIVVQPRWVDGGEPLVRDLVRSFRRPAAARASASSKQVAHHYRVYDSSFESSVQFELPCSFAFQSGDERGRIWCTSRPKEAPFEVPHWSSRFELDPDCILSTPSDRSGRIVSAHVRPPELAGPSFDEKHWTITALDPGGATRPLTWCEARTDVNAAPFRIWFAHEGDASEALALWSSVLNSARRA